MPGSPAKASPPSTGHYSLPPLEPASDDAKTLAAYDAKALAAHDVQALVPHDARVQTIP
jgi:hypothetical protein